MKTILITLALCTLAISLAPSAEAAPNPLCRHLLDSEVGFCALEYGCIGIEDHNPVVGDTCHGLPFYIE